MNAYVLRTLSKYVAALKIKLCDKRHFLFTTKIICHVKNVVCDVQAAALISLKVNVLYYQSIHQTLHRAIFSAPAKLELVSVLI